MSSAEVEHFEHTLAFHAAPTLLGVKCGSLLALSVEEYDLEQAAELIGGCAYGSEIKVRVVERYAERSLVYVYHSGLLAEKLAAEGVGEFLEKYGYSLGMTAEEYLDKLCERLEDNEFPHEIGIFLGYPLEDVKGFIRNCGQNCKYCGVWKVYGDVERAKELFECYKQCRIRLCRELEQGKRLCSCVA